MSICDHSSFSPSRAGCLPLSSSSSLCPAGGSGVVCLGALLSSAVLCRCRSAVNALLVAAGGTNAWAGRRTFRPTKPWRCHTAGKLGCNSWSSENKLAYTAICAHQSYALSLSKPWHSAWAHLLLLRLLHGHSAPVKAPCNAHEGRCKASILPTRHAALLNPPGLTNGTCAAVGCCTVIVSTGPASPNSTLLCV